MKNLFKSLVIEENLDGSFSSSIKKKSISDLPVGELLIKVSYSSLNYKDALSVSGNKGVTRAYPHTPGIDAVGIVENSETEKFKIGDEVIVSGFDLGMNTSGGFGQYIRVPNKWACHLPNGLSALDSMAIGTAGLTAGLSAYELKKLNGIEGREAVITGATGGVGTFAIKILNILGAKITAITSKKDCEGFLKSLGADKIILRDDFLNSVRKPMNRGTWDMAIDVVGGDILSGLIPSMKYGGTIVCCGNVAGPNFEATVFPYILRANRLIGIDSAETSIDKKKKIWNLFGKEWKMYNLEKLFKSVSINEIMPEINKILSGNQIGRVVLNHKQ